MKFLFKTLLVMVALAALGSAPAFAQCSINGTITAALNSDPLGPTWAYTVVIDWDTGTQYALSHMDLILDTAAGTCDCQDFHDAISFDATIGSSDGEGGCTVEYYGELNCQGDPSIPGVDGIILKFEPFEGQGCEPGTTGQGTFVFYSNLGPVPIDEDILSVVDKYSNNYCFGHLSGDFPGMTCDPVDVEAESFGNVKGLYR